MMLVSLTNQLGYNLSFPLSPLPTTFRLICGLEKSRGGKGKLLCGKEWNALRAAGPCFRTGRLPASAEDARGASLEGRELAAEGASAHVRIWCARLTGRREGVKVS